MNNIFQTRDLFTGSLVATISIMLILLAGTACQTRKAAKGPTHVGDNVKLVELRQVIQTQVADPSRSAALLSIVSHAEQELGAANKGYLKQSEEFGKASADHSKSAQDLDAILREWDKQASDRRLRLSNMLLTMKTHATPEEWPTISNAFFNSLMRQSDRFRALRKMNS